VISFLQQHPAIVLFAAVALWVMLTALMTYSSGWLALVHQYPDQAERPMLRIRWQSGTLAGGKTRGVLKLSACPSGLRIGMSFFMGPFCRPFFVPWEHLTIVRENTFLGPTAKLQFGTPVNGTIPLSAYAANRLARAAGTRWPEPGPFPDERGAYVREILALWAIGTSAMVLFFLVIPLAINPSNRPPILLAIALILFPALVFGVGSVVRFLFEIR
jgi:hypothetical protein